MNQLFLANLLTLLTDELTQQLEREYDSAVVELCDVAEFEIAENTRYSQQVSTVWTPVVSSLFVTDMLWGAMALILAFSCQ